MRLRVMWPGDRVADHLTLLKSWHAENLDSGDGLEAKIAGARTTLPRRARAWANFQTFG